VRLCAQHLPYGYTMDELLRAEGGFGPITMHYRDGWDFVDRSTASYDIVVVDLPDERTAPAQRNRLYDADFLERCRDTGNVVVGPSRLSDALAEQVIALVVAALSRKFQRCNLFRQRRA
jgi:spermidine synthase